MAHKNKHLAMLEKHGISATFQRLAVLQALAAHAGHPNAEEIYEALGSLYPPISKATVYNVLRLYSDRGIIKPLRLEGDSIRYDTHTDDHAHFECAICGRVRNVPLIPPQTQTSLAGYAVSHVDVYYRGTCPDCLSKITARPLAGNNIEEDMNEEPHGKERLGSQPTQQK